MTDAEATPKPERQAPGTAPGPRGDAYQVVARRFRPRTFDELVGQEEVVRSMRSALDSGTVPHAFLFAGSRGVGKTTIARILARALNCEKGVSSTPCGQCERCQSILAESDPDVVEIDAASNNGVEDIRSLREKAGYAAMRGRRKVFILDEVHMLSRPAFNAFLKILEEPPEHVTFVMATTELHKVPDTIRSRCQVHIFRRAGEAAIAQRLAQICRSEGVDVEPAILVDIARGSRGGLRDAESALERVLPLLRESGRAFSLEDYRRNAGRMGLDRVATTLLSILAGDGVAALQLAAQVATAGVDERECLGEVLEVLRSLLHLKIDGPDSLLVPFQGTLREQLVVAAGSLAAHQIEAAIQVAILGRDRIRRFDDRQLLLELTLLRLGRAGELQTLRDVLDRLDGTAGNPPPPAAAPRSAPGASRVGPPTVPRAAEPGPERRMPQAPGPGAAPIAPAGPVAVPAGSLAAPGGPVPATSAVPADLGARLREVVERERSSLAEAFRSCAIGNEPGVVRLTFTGVAGLLRDRLESDITQTWLREAVARLVGGGLRVVMTFAMAGEAAAGPARMQAPEAHAAAAPRPPAPPEPSGSTSPTRPAAPTGPAAAGGVAEPVPGPLAEKVRKRFDGRFLPSE